MARYNPLLQEALINCMRDETKETEAVRLLGQVPKENLPLIGYSFFTPLLYASYLGRPRLVTYLLSKLDPASLQVSDNYGRNALLNAVLSGNFDTVELLSRYISLDSFDRHHNSALHLAVSHPPIVEFLLSKGLNPNTENMFKATALHMAAQENKDTVRILIRAGARVDCKDGEQWTPLHYAVYCRNVDIVKTLLDMNADLTCKNNAEELPIDLAKDAPDIAALLVLHTSTASPVLSSSNHPDFQPSLELYAPHDPIIPPQIVEHQALVHEVNSIDGTVNGVELPPKFDLNATILSAIVRKNQGLLSIDLDSLTKYGVEIVPYKELILKEELGRGGYGRVHRGIFRNNTVAVKIVNDRGYNDKVVRDFLKEIECLVKIRHDRFLMLQAICLEGPLCMVTELAKGGNLSDALEKGLIDADEKPLISLQIAQGMSFIHSKTPPIIHRDLKPQNILLDRYKQVKIGDLGLSRCVAGTAANTMRLESTELFAGTVRYMAPEHFDDNPVITRGTDVWAFGCIVSQIFSGKVPWHGLELPAVQRRLLLKTEFPLDPGLTPQIQDLVSACCRIETAARPKFAEIITRLEAIIGVPSSQLS